MTFLFIGYTRLNLSQSWSQMFAPPLFLPLPFGICLSPGYLLSVP